SSLDTGLIINPADDQNAPIGIVAYYTSPGLLLLFYIKIETLPPPESLNRIAEMIDMRLTAIPYFSVPHMNSALLWIL
ncbi:MAG: hypothetical protein KBI12_08835, partial [Methanothrix sp.]|nr:hypothetical protein [Methanothrix sp.]